MSEITGFNKDAQGIFIVKDPTANVAYTLDWSEYLTSGVSINSATVTIQTHTGDSSALAHPTGAGTDVTISAGQKFQCVSIMEKQAKSTTLPQRLSQTLVTQTQDILEL